MHILLTDILICPRCGPEHGLILLADRIEDRRVLAGRFGCSNCRATYEVRRGEGYFDGEPGRAAESPSGDAAIRIAALLGIEPGSRYVLLCGPAAAHAPALRALFDGVEVITVHQAETSPDDAVDVDAAASSDINNIGMAARLPFANLRLSGVALTGSCADALLAEGARVVAPLGRLLLEPVPDDAAARLEAAGMRVLARDDSALVAAHG